MKDTDELLEVLSEGMEDTLTQCGNDRTRRAMVTNLFQCASFHVADGNPYAAVERLKGGADVMKYVDSLVQMFITDAACGLEAAIEVAA